MSFSIKNKRIGWGGGGGSTPPPRPVPYVDIVYAELYNLITTAALVKGTVYRLLDYKSVNFINGINMAIANDAPQINFDARQIYTSPNEVLLLTAMSSYELEPQGYSETNQGDIIQYQAYYNAIGLPFRITNGATLPDSTTVSGFDLQWDGVNVYFNMPTDYPALFGQYFNISCSFESGAYRQIGVFSPLTPVISIPQQDQSAPNIPMSRLSVRDSGTKVVLLDLTYLDYTNYDADSLNVYTYYAIGDAYGQITQRNDTFRSIITPFDFRNIKYRRFQVDLTSINVSLGLGYWGIGDLYLTAPYQQEGNPYQDFYVFGNTGASFDIQWTFEGNNSAYDFSGIDNNVILGKSYSLKFGINVSDNTIFNCNDTNFGNNITVNISIDCENNIIKGNFNSNFIGGNFRQNNIDLNFFNNNILDGFALNNIGDSFSGNVLASNFNQNNIDFGFQNNTISSYFKNNNIGYSFINNDIADNFNTNYIKNDFGGNTIANGFDFNTIGSNFQNNGIGISCTNNFILDWAQSNTIAAGFQQNRIGYFFGINVDSSVYGNFILTNFTNNQIGNNFSKNTFAYKDTGINNAMYNVFGDYCYNNTLGDTFQYNSVFQLFQNNVIGSNFFGNNTEAYFADNTIGDYMVNNTVSSAFNGNTIYGGFGNNVVASNFTNNNIQHVLNNCIFNFSFENNTTSASSIFNNNLINVPLSSVDFSAATLVYGGYTKYIMQGSDNNYYLNYYDGAVNQFITPITT